MRSTTRVGRVSADRACSNADTYTDSLFRAFDATASGRSDTHAWRFRIAGRGVEVRSAGGAIGTRLTAALAHLTVDDANAAPALRIGLWDQAGSRADVPFPPWLRNSHPDEQWRYDDGRIRILVHRESAYRRTTMLLLDRPSGRALYWVSDVATAPYWEIANPLRLLFCWWAEAVRLQMLHAGAVGDRRGAVLFVGNAGSGKSSSALACLENGMEFLGDDLVIMEGGERPMVHSLYATAKLKADNVHRFPRLQSTIRSLDRGEQDKAILFLQNEHAPQLVASREVRALLVPRIRNEPTGLFPISRGAALRALAPSTIKLLGTDGGALARMAELIRSVPVFGLNIGSRPADIPGVIEPLLG